MATIYLSSTYSDLRECREAIYHSLRRMHHDVQAMEDYVATDQRPLDKCLADVGTCDLYLGVFAWRYGYIPQDGNPEGKSITELEYRKAIETGKAALIFLLDEQASWQPSAMDAFTGEGHHGEDITSLRRELSQEKLVSFFQTCEQLASQVSAAVYNWEKNQFSMVAMDPLILARTKYLESVCRRYSTVTLPLGPAEGFLLHAVFQPLALYRDPLSAADLAREKRRALLGEVSLDENDPSYLRLEWLEKHFSERTRQPFVVVTADNGEDALKKSPQGRLVLLGGPGTGKTTTLKYLTSVRAKKALADLNAPVPIFLSLADLVRSGKTLQHYLTDIVDDMGADRNYADILRKNIEQGQAFICLDSLDEVDPSQRARVIELINNWAADTGNTWLIGSRFTEYKEGQFKQGQFAEWELLPMNHELRQELAERLLTELKRLLPDAQGGTVSASDFVSCLEQHPQAAAWGENPLLFSLAAVVFIQTGGLPSSRTTLYREVIEAVLKMREHDPMWCKLLLRLLTDLALWLQQAKGRTFTSDDLLTFLLDIQKRPLKEAADLANHIIASGILEIVARETFGFKHQTFQDYLAAVGLARRLISQDTATREEVWNLAWSKRTYSRWTEVLRLMVGTLAQEEGIRGMSEAQRWLSNLLDQGKTSEGDPGNLGLMLALKSLGEMIEIPEWDQAKITQLEEEIISTWIDKLLEAACSRRNTMKEHLMNLAHDVGYLNRNTLNIAVKLLGAALVDPNKIVRETALEALGELREKIPIELLLVALSDESRNVRSEAVKALGKQGERAPLEPLLAALQDEDEDVRSAAVEALGELGERVPLEPLLTALQDEDWLIRSAALEVLGELGERVPLEPLLTALQDEYEDVRSAAVEALGKQGERIPLELFMLMLGDENKDVRLSSIQALKKNAPEILFTITSEATSILQGKPAGKILGSLAQGFNAEVIGNVGYSLPLLLEKLIQLLDWPYWQVQVKAAQALSKLRRNIPDMAIRRLLQLRCDPNPQMRNVREAADEALAEILSLETGIEDD